MGLHVRSRRAQPGWVAVLSALSRQPKRTTSGGRSSMCCVAAARTPAESAARGSPPAAASRQVASAPPRASLVLGSRLSLGLPDRRTALNRSALGRKPGRSTDVGGGNGSGHPGLVARLGWKLCVDLVDGDKEVARRGASLGPRRKGPALGIVQAKKTASGIHLICAVCVPPLSPQAQHRRSWSASHLCAAPSPARMPVEGVSRRRIALLTWQRQRATFEGEACRLCACALR